MGNRAHIIFTDGERIGPATYLHWNGGPESVYRFLEETERRMGGRFGDVEYTSARFVQTCGDFLDNGGQEGLSLGIIAGPGAITPEALKPYDHGDNGVYVVTFGNATNGVGGWGMRRFLGQHPDYELTELSAAQVTAERREADGNAMYADGLRGVFSDLTTYIDNRAAAERKAEATQVSSPAGIPPDPEPTPEPEPRSGRAPSGNLRNFHAMKPDKLTALRVVLQAEGNDPEAIGAAGSAWWRLYGKGQVSLSDNPWAPGGTDA